MEKYKRYITMMATAFMVMGMSLTAQALTPSENSATVFPAEGNGNCNDYAENGVIMAISASLPGSGSASDGTETVTYTYDSDLNELTLLSSTVPIDFLAIKAKRSIGVFIYPSGGVDMDTGITLDGTAFGSVDFCYGLNNLKD